MAKSYLDKTGLTKVITWIKGELSKKVTAVSGKGLSTNDYTTAEKNKLSGIAVGAEVNVIAAVKVDGTALTPDANKAVNVDLSGKVDKVSGKQLSTNDYTTAEKTKLGGVAAGAQVNVLEIVKVNGTALTPASKAVNIDLSSYAKKTDVEAAIHYKGIKNTVSDLPTTGSVIGDMWNVKSTGANYAWDGTAWDKLSENIDLSGLLTKTEFETYKTSVAMVALTDAEIDAVIAAA